jgi:hypothetical protein
MTNGRKLKATPGWVLALTSAAALMVALDQLVVANELSTIQRELHTSSETLEWTAGLTAGASAIVGGSHVNENMPFIAAIQGNHRFCTGALISPVIVRTHFIV